MSYKTIVGLEIHVELSTATKAFCGCENAFGREPNTLTCPVCLALPGAMPVLNRNVVEYSVMAGHALNCSISNISKFDRKNYFYPDLTKGFQITQDDMAIANNGYVEIEGDNGIKRVGIQKVQMEEDTGKSLHTEDGSTLMDYNRCGVPLIEIVSYPDISSAKEASGFLNKLRDTLRYIGISNVKMEEGSLRCDVNINVVDEESGAKTAVTEVKNLNSFRGVEKAIEYEVNRHIKMLKSGESELRTTRRWDDVENKTQLMRVKYTVADYRFAPEGDLPPVVISDEEIEEIFKKMPELPEEKRERFIKDYSISEYDAKVLTANRNVADFYEEAAREFKDYNMLSNWIMGEVLRRSEEDEDGNISISISPKSLVELLTTISEGKINNNAGKKVLREMFETGSNPREVIEKLGLVQISDSGEIEKIVDEVLAENPQSIEDYKAGKDRAIGFLVGQVMKKSKGKANPGVVNSLLLEKLK